MGYAKALFVVSPLRFEAVQAREVSAWISTTPWFGPLTYACTDMEILDTTHRYSVSLLF